ncbi:MAG TPA: FkbM family methyltransferase, partial [Verrucomicrobiae bacterium]
CLGLARGGVKHWFYRQWTHAGGHQPADILTHGLKLRLHAHDNTTESKLLLGSRARDREELDFLLGHLPEGGCFLDVGANIGFYSLIAASRRHARVLAIEPLPAAFERLQFNVRANGLEHRIATLNAALGPERKRVAITVADGDLGSSSIVKTGLGGRTIEVPMVPLADALAEHGFTNVDAMKIDVEGMEDSVLCPFFQSAPQSLWPRCVVIEDVHHGNWKEDVIALMCREGYHAAGRTGSNAMLRLPAAGLTRPARGAPAMT